MLPPRRTAILALFLALPAIGLTAAGCVSDHGLGRIRSESLGENAVVLYADYQTSVYAHDEAGDTSIFLSDIPADDLLDGSARFGQILHIELLWVPKAGATPMDASATNASIRHIVIADGELGIYGGAGFAMPKHAPGEGELTISLRDGNVRLLDATAGFADPLSPARLRGTITAALDPAETQRLHRAISQYVTNALKKQRFVMASVPARVGIAANAR